VSGQHSIDDDIPKEVKARMLIIDEAAHVSEVSTLNLIRFDAQIIVFAGDEYQLLPPIFSQEAKRIAE
jgi:superfamily I DNA and/or RNA helicase